MPDWRVETGDCLEVMRTLPDASVDAVVTDPPYGMSYQSAWSEAGSRFAKIANDDRPFVWWLYDAARVLKVGGCLLCFCRWDTAEAFRLAIEWAGLKVVSQLIWDRGVHGMGDVATFPGPRHDTIWMASKGRFTFPGRRPVSVLPHQRVAASDLLHPNQKPIPLMQELVRDYTPPGGLILDPFTGSGSTGKAAILEGFRFIGIEREPEYAEIARARIAQAVEHAGLYAESKEAVA
jgi:DNA modification methylase